MIRIKSFKWKKISQSPLPLRVRLNLFEVDVMAKKKGWTILSFNPIKHTIELKREDVIMIVYLENMTIYTSLVHPVSGQTELYRKRLTKKEREQIFINPRTHTNKGFHRKQKNGINH